MKLKRPMPPEALLYGSVSFAPAAGVDEFVRALFLDTSSTMHIEEHAILSSARIGYLWASPEARNRDKAVAAQAQIIVPTQKKWSSLRAADQVLRWFGGIDFLITISAPIWVEQLNDNEALATLDHELSHCVQLRQNGDLRFTREGEPRWMLRSHDVEQFIGVTERWGARAAGVEQLVAAAKKKPRFGNVDIQRVVDGCGTCLGIAA